ncbi:MAG: 3-phosphoshikimate 1-carboxyvinyltransferase [Deltaproteobacteria bacterium]|nr:MAG: 3-phosphoshikimate 1-carboxyvinyltransferase [Deltaproteobacteria bacterium]
MRVHPSTGLTGVVSVPGDKSVTHRALLLGAIAEGRTLIRNPGHGEDNRTTARVLREMGVEVTIDAEPGAEWSVMGRGPGALRPPTRSLDCGNSGTTVRLLAGLLAGCGVPATLVGDESLMERPMARVADPLMDLGHDVRATGPRGRLPLVVGSSRPVPEPDEGEEGLPPLRVLLRTASAQVKSAVLLACLQRPGLVEIVEPAPSRDHTERMLRAMGRRVTSSSHYLTPGGTGEPDQAPRVALHPGGALRGRTLDVPGDLSSAAFVLAAGLLRGEDVVVRGVGVNPTRTGFLDAIERMGARVAWSDRSVGEGGEPVATLSVSASRLRAIHIEEGDVPRVIDELPLLAVLCAAADGESSLAGAAELRVKESDRIETTSSLVKALGADIETSAGGWRIRGLGEAKFAAFDLDVSADHRLALSAGVAALAAAGPCVLEGHSILEVSFPEWMTTMRALGARIEEDS